MFENMTPKEIRTTCEYMVRGPGKFEGESPYIPWFYAASLNGEGEYLCAEDTVYDTEDGYTDASIEYVRFVVTQEDVTIFPGLLEVAQVVDIYETSDGFVCEM